MPNHLQLFKVSEMHEVLVIREGDQLYIEKVPFDQKCPPKEGMNRKVKDVNPNGLRLRITFNDIDYRDYYGNDYLHDGLLLFNQPSKLKDGKRVPITLDYLKPLIAFRLSNKLSIPKKWIDELQPTITVEVDSQTNEEYIHYHVHCDKGTNIFFRLLNALEPNYVQCVKLISGVPTITTLSVGNKYPDKYKDVVNIKLSVVNDWGEPMLTDYATPQVIITRVKESGEVLTKENFADTFMKHAMLYIENECLPREVIYLNKSFMGDIQDGSIGPFFHMKFKVCYRRVKHL